MLIGGGGSNSDANSSYMMLREILNPVISFVSDFCFVLNSFYLFLTCNKFKISHNIIAKNKEAIF